MTASQLAATNLAFGAGSDVPFDELDGAVPVSDFEYLEGLPPGPILAMVLDQIDRTRLSGYDLVLVMKARQRQVSHDQAELYEDMVELGFCPPSNPGDLPVRSDEFFEYTADEVRGALVWTRRAAAVAVDYAFEMMVRFPQIGRALSEGAIDLSRARVIVNEVSGLTESESVVVIDRTGIDDGPDSVPNAQIVYRCGPRSCPETVRIRRRGTTGHGPTPPRGYGRFVRGEPRIRPRGSDNVANQRDGPSAPSAR